MKQTNVQSYASQKPTLENSVHYIAHIFSFLATAKDTGGAFSLIHCYFRKGFTPPPHYHTLEEESFFILEGEIDFHVGDTKVKSKCRGIYNLTPKCPTLFQPCN
jgi:quercetin dioxygenase-like cupin family protein